MTQAARRALPRPRTRPAVKTLGRDGEPVALDSLDPAKASHTADYLRMFVLYSGLTEFDSAFKVQNALAEAFEIRIDKLWVRQAQAGRAFPRRQAVHGG